MAKKKAEEITENVNVNENINIENLQEKPTEHTATAETIEEQTIAKKLLSLHNIQQICSKIDQIRVIRGELPNEVRDLEDAHEGMLTRIAKYKEDVEELQQKITNQDLKIKESLALIKRD